MRFLLLLLWVLCTNVDFHLVEFCFLPDVSPVAFAVLHWLTLDIKTFLVPCFKELSVHRFVFSVWKTVRCYFLGSVSKEDACSNCLIPFVHKYNACFIFIWWEGFLFILGFKQFDEKVPLLRFAVLWFFGSLWICEMKFSSNLKNFFSVFPLNIFSSCLFSWCNLRDFKIFFIRLFA